MPGANCCLPECTTSRYKRKNGSIGEVETTGEEETTGEDETTSEIETTDEEQAISFFKITTRNSDFHKEWRKNVLQIVKRYREDVDENFIKQMMAGKKWICSRHYKEEDIKTSGESRLVKNIFVNF